MLFIFKKKLFIFYEDVIDVIWAEGNLENRSTHTSVYFLFPDTMVRAEKNWIHLLIWFFDRWEFYEVSWVDNGLSFLPTLPCFYRGVLLNSNVI